MPLELCWLYCLLDGGASRIGLQSFLKFIRQFEIMEKEKKEKSKEHSALTKKSNTMQAEFEYSKMRKENLYKDLEMQKEIAETKRVRLAD